jgi:putative effector of murein hydrolase LrgA (UPF0299 family)
LVKDFGYIKSASGSARIQSQYFILLSVIIMATIIRLLCAGYWAKYFIQIISFNNTKIPVRQMQLIFPLYR